MRSGCAGAPPGRSSVPMGTTRELFRGDGIDIVEHVCTYGPEDRPFEEWLCAANVAFVMAGAFAVRAPAGSAPLGPGSVMLGNEGDPYTCVHEVGRGDVCISFGYSADLLEEAGRSLGTRPRFRGISLGPMPAFAAVPAIARKSPAAIEEAALELLGRILDADAGSQRGVVRPRPAAARSARGGLRRPRPPEEGGAAEALRHIDAHSGEPLSLAILAERARLTRFH